MMTTVEIVGSATHAGGPVNEDRIGAAARFAWVLDGATGLTPERMFPGASDAAWFAQTWSSALAAHAHAAASPLALIAAAHKAVGEQVRAASRDVSTAALPALALALIAVEDDEIEICNIGDCSTVVRTGLCPATRVGFSSVDRFDALALEILKRAFAQGRSYAEAFSLAKAQILANRRLANTPDGYWVVDPTDRWLRQVQCERLPWSGGDILLATDGFMRVVDVYSIAEDDDGVFAFMREHGPDGVIRCVRQIEAADPECRSFPRLKPADDASALWLSSVRRGVSPAPLSLSIRGGVASELA